MSYLTNIPLISNLSHLVEWLLLFNVLLTGAVILLAFRAAHYKQRAEDLESELRDSIRETISRESPDQPVVRRRVPR